LIAAKAGKRYSPGGHLPGFFELMKLSQTRKVRTAIIELGDGLSFTIEHRSFSPEEWDRVDKEAKDEKWGLVKELSNLLVSTGLEDDNGNPIGPTEENLRQIELPILKAMLSAILGTTLPKKPS
jgi:hypothetical protein